MKHRSLLRRLSSPTRLLSSRWLLLPAVLGVACHAGAQSGVWTGGSGTYSDSGNWQGGTVAGGANNTADFSTLDISGDVQVTVSSDFTIGNLAFGDTNLASAATWYITGLTNTVTLDAAAPTITAGPLTPTAPAFDDTYFEVQLAGSNGFTKLGDGVFTIAGDATGLTGPVNVNEGTLRLDGSGALDFAAAPVTLANGATIQNMLAASAMSNITVAPGASATVRQTGNGAFLSNIVGQGTGETLNLVVDRATTTVTSGADWSGFDEVNMTGLGLDFSGVETGEVSFFRASINGDAWNGNSFANSVVNLDTIEFFVRTNSFGNDVSFGALNGTDTAALRGGNGGSGGSAIRYTIGGNNADSDFAGTVVGGGGPSGNFGGMSIDKIGTGTHTFSGTFVDPMVGPNTDIGRQGGVIRVSEGTLAFAGTADSVPGGFGTNKSTIDVLAGATLDVSGTTNTFSSSPLQQIQGSGTIVGPFNHAAGELRPADVSTPDDNTTLTNFPVQTFGTLTFDGNLAFNGGSIAYDMNPTPGGDDLIQVNGSTSVSGGGVVDPVFVGGDPAVGQTYTFLSSTGGFSDAVAGWTVVWPGRGAKPEVFIDGNDLKFTTVPLGAPGSVVWSGATNATWDVETTQNWTLGGSPDVYFQGDDVRFDNTGANKAVTLAATMNPRDVVVDSTAAYSITGGSIVATGSLTKRGSGTLTLDNANAFASVTVEGGTIDTSEASETLGTGPMTLSGGSIINIGNGASLGVSSIEVSDGTTNSLQYVGSGSSAAADRPYIPTLTGGGELNVTMSTNSSWINLGNVNNFSGTLSIAPDGTNATILENVRTGGAGASMPNGTLILTAVTIANRNAGSGEFTQAYGELQGDSGSVLNGYVGGATSVANVNWEIGALGTDSDFAGLIIDGDDDGDDDLAVSRLTKVGEGTLTLSGANTYSGSTTIDTGTLSITNPYLHDMADVFIDDDALFELNFGGQDTINALFLDGVPQAAGTYGAIGNGSAQFQTALITGTGLLNVTALGEVVGVPGDFNNDGVVNAADYTVYRDNIGSPTTLPNDDGLGTPVGSDHYDLWVANFGATAPGAGAFAQAVPEPASGLLGLLLCGAAAIRRRG